MALERFIATFVVASCLASLSCDSLASAAPLGDEIVSLPGWSADLPSAQYSGYLDFGPNNRKHIHYWFVAAEKEPATAPVVVWLNGGPGCSSLDGFIYEHGPFRVDQSDPSKLVLFEQRWSKVANMVYLEAPVGVGFSYSDRPDLDYNATDDSTAIDSTDALNVFFAEKFPELKGNGLYITGESYGGVYVPTLAESILWYQGNGTWNGAELKGIAVGNGCSGTTIGVCGGQRDQFDTEYLLGTAFIPNSLKTKIRQSCTNWSQVTPECKALLAEASHIVGHVNLYDVYGECIDAPESDRAKKIPLGNDSILFQQQQKTRYGHTTFGGPDACIDSRFGSAYLNQPSVLKAAHLVKQDFKWSTCGNDREKGWTYTSTRPNLPRDTYPFLNSKIAVVIYNGDWDMCVPYTDGESWTEGMGYPVAKHWHPWMYNNKSQVAGYATVYDTPYRFTFITVKGGRHEVPETAPEQALELLTRLVKGEQF